MSRKPIALALGFVLPLLGVATLSLGVLSPESLYPTVLRLTTPSIRTDREGASPVVMVEIDNAALDAQGPWPWSSERTDSLLRSVAVAGARAVVIDRSMFPDVNHNPTAGLWNSYPVGVSVVLPARPADGADPDACRIWKLPVTEMESSFPRIGSQILPEGVPCDERFSAGFVSDVLLPL